MHDSALALVYAVTAVGVGHHVELLALGDELVDQQLEALVVAVVIAGAVDQQQVALEVLGMGDGRAVGKTLGVVLGQPHVAFLIDGVVDLLVGDGCDRHAHGIELRVAEKSVQGHGAAAAPAPRADTLRVDEGEGVEHGPDTGCLIHRREDADLTVDRLAPLAPARGGRAAIVEAGHQVAALRQQQVPQISSASPAVLHRLACGLTVDEHQKRVDRCRVEVGRRQHPAVHLDPVADVDPKDLDGSFGNRIECGLHLGIVLEDAFDLVTGQRHQAGARHPHP